MQTTQLACPHCGSMLNLAGVIAPGTPVTCLICTQAFSAAPIAVATTAPAPATAPKPQAGILVSKPFAAAKPKREPSPPIAQASASGKAMLWAVALSLLVLLTASTGFAIWKLNDVGRSGSAGSIEQTLAANQAPGSQPKVGDDATPMDQAKIKDVAADKTPPPGDDSSDDDNLRKIKEKQKNLLKRKPTASASGKEPEFDPVTTINVAAPSVPGVEPVRVNAAVEKGVAFLKRTQAANGAWGGTGPTALGALTLLECKVPPKDVHVQRAAYFIRSNAAALGMTYEISLAILFLDRLGEPRDGNLIRGLALRLLAGQRECGGWSYDCPQLNPQEMYQLYLFLRSHQPATALPAKKDNNPDLKALAAKPGAEGDSLREFGRMIADKDPTLDPKDPPPMGKKAPAAVKKTPLRPEKLAPHLRLLPVVRNQDKGKENQQLRFGAGGGGDNSNTQFALLALWAARRHEIPIDSAVLSAYQRFVICQSLDFGWGYQALGFPSESSNTMTCVGLLGLAMGHGVAPEVMKRNPNDPKDVVAKPALQDPRIGNGLKALAKYLGAVSPDKENVGGYENMYFLWSVERVAMLYDLNTIDGKDWYGWGAQKLLKHQNDQGDWPSAHYPGDNPHVNTCFALLFLKRSNLVQDLTHHLRQATSVPDVEK